MKNNNLPDFLIIGAAKAGTTSLYRYLLNHPNINLSKKQKEGRFFSSMPNNFKGPGDEGVNKSIPKTIYQYLNLFDNNNKLKGDISPDYLYYHKTTISNVLFEKGKNIKIIILLRNPVERAFSQYMHFRRENREELAFEEAIKNENKRKIENWEWAWRYIEVGLYYQQVKAYLENFSHVKIFLFEDLKDDTQKVVDETCSFLGVPTIKINSDKIYNKSGIPKKNWQTNFYNNIVRSDNTIKKVLKNFLPENAKKMIGGKLREKLFENNLEKPQMKPETRKMLIDYYKEDILKLQELINRDLTNWLK